MVSVPISHPEHRYTANHVTRVAVNASANFVMLLTDSHLLQNINSLAHLQLITAGLMV